MRRNVIETVLGAVVLAVAVFFLVFAYTSANLRQVSGYPLTANFSNISGIQAGSDVRISGVKVGSVSGLTLDPKTYLAVVHMTIDPSYKLPKDTVATVASESLLGGKYMSLEPGGSDKMIPPGGNVQFTQSSPGLEQLLGQVIFSLQNVGNKNQGSGGNGNGAAPNPSKPGATPPGSGL